MTDTKDQKKVAVVIGVGPEDGLGGALCKRFAARDLHVFVAGRTLAKVDAVAEAIARAGGTATALSVDATSEEAVVALFEAACAAGELEVAIYNAGNNFAGRIKEMDASYFEACWRVGCFGGFLFGREAARRMSSGSVLFTGARLRASTCQGSWGGRHSRWPCGGRRRHRRREDQERSSSSGGAIGRGRHGGA